MNPQTPAASPPRHGTGDAAGHNEGSVGTSAALRRAAPGQATRPQPEPSRSATARAPAAQLLRPCLDCGQATTGSYCGSHAVRAPDLRRGREHRSHKWRRLSSRIRAAQPWCEHCGTSQRLQVDHRVPLSVDPSREYDVTNLRVLCAVCHGRVGSQQRGHGGVTRDHREVANHGGRRDVRNSPALPVPGARL